MVYEWCMDVLWVVMRSVWVMYVSINRVSKAWKFFILVLTCYCFNSINTTGHRLDQYEPSTPSTKGLLEKAMNRANKTWQFFMLVLTCYCAII